MFDSVKDNKPEENKKPMPDKKPENQEAKPAKDRQVDQSAQPKEEIHTMPMDYYLGEQTKEAAKATSVPGNEKIKKVAEQVKTAKANKSGNKKFFLLFVTVTGLAIITLAVWLFWQVYIAPPAENVRQAEETQVARQNQTDQTQLGQEQNQEEQDEEEFTPPAQEEPAEEEESEEIEVAELEEFDPTDIKEFSIDLLKNTDWDNDGLTDMEEDLLGTNQLLIDTDKDGYQDHEEIENYYSPLQAGTGRLWEAPFMTEYENGVYGYSFIYPEAWRVEAMNDEDPRELVITLSPEEFINVIVYEKQPSVSTTQWYSSLAPGVDVDELSKYENYRGLDVLESPDGFTVYIGKGDRVYTINYNIGLKDKADYPALFALIVDSFELDYLRQDGNIETPSVGL